MLSDRRSYGVSSETAQRKQCSGGSVTLAQCGLEGTIEKVLDQCCDLNGQNCGGTIRTSVTCDTGAGCGLCLQLISPSDCPEDLDSLRRCDDASVGFGDLCVGDGACGTNPAARNCGHAVYRNVDVCVCDDLEPEEVIDRWRSGQGDLEPEKGICSTALEQSTCPDLVRRGYCRASCRACKPRTVSYTHLTLPTKA